jgi:hypothetical protein
LTGKKELESERYDRIAELISTNDSWLEDDEICDEEIIAALKIAASALRLVGK